jgi:nucleoid-associated protein YgaU
MGNGAKLALVGVLALIVLVVAVWDRRSEERHDESVRGFPVAPIEARQQPRVRVVTSEPAAEDRVSGQLTQGPLATSGTLHPGGKTPLARPQAPLVPLERPREGTELAAASRAAPPSPPPATAGKRYVVRASDSLFAIAQREYGAGALWKRILDANREEIKDPNRLPVGKEIVIPPLEAPEGPRTAATTVRPALSHTTEVTTLPALARTYTVESGDTLDRIAAKTLGSAQRWRAILEANRDKLADETSIRPGQQLVIPAGR